MKKLLLLILILTSYPVFAACPVDGTTNACIADIERTPITEPTQTLMPQMEAKKEFSATPSNIGVEREIQPEKGVRDFGPNNQNYGYNSSCQFGICRTTGTPKNFTPDSQE